MEIITTLAIIAVAGLIHASFQLSVSVLTLLSSHTIGHKRSHKRLIVLSNSFVFGVALMTILLLSFTALVLQYVATLLPSLILVWVASCGLLLGVGVAVWIFYYRRGPGTVLWIPRHFARYLSARSKATNEGAEAFGLGLTSVVSELLFICAPLVVTALLLLELSQIWQLVGILIYTLTSLLSLGIVNGLIGSGHSISRIQKWREANKGFLQFAAGSGLLILGFYLYVDQVLLVTVLANAGSV